MLLFIPTFRFLDADANRIVHLNRTAAEFSLYPIYMKEFHEVFAENREHREFGPLLEKMKVVNAKGESQMDEDQWEAASTCFSLLLLLLF